MSNIDQNSVDAGNAAFWNELCGTSLARAIGVTDDSPQSLERYDAWYMSLYPYLMHHVRPHEMKGRRTLEIGLGYGTLSQKIAEAGADYQGLDIAAGPVAMVRHRLSQQGLAGNAIQGSILDAPFDDASFDFIVTIGCLHHTGDLAAAIRECRRLLKPGGTLVLMVYNAYSYRRWYQSPRSTLDYLLREARGYRGVVEALKASERALYDSDGSGAAAPHTDWISIKSLRVLCGDFQQVTIARENIDQEPPFARFERGQLLRTPIPKWLGLDLYARARA